jgi:hypothetical protein
LVQGFDASDHLVVSDTQIYDSFAVFLDQPISLAIGLNDIKSVTVTPTNLSDAFGNISYSIIVPTPTPLWLALVGAGLLAARGVFRPSQE